MIKMAYVTVVGLFLIVILYPTFGYIMDLGIYIYETGIMQYPPSVIVVMLFIHDTAYPYLPIISIGVLIVFDISYGLFKRYVS